MNGLTIRFLLLGIGTTLGGASTVVQAIEVYKAKPVERYEAQPVAPVTGQQIQPHRATQTKPYRGTSVAKDQGGKIEHHRAGQVQKHEGGSTPRLLTRKERDEMLRNDAAAGRTRQSMSRGQSTGGTSDAQARVNHYSNQNTLNNRMNQSGTIGYNPYRNE